MPLKSRHTVDEDDPKVAKIGHPAPPWMVNYADLMTELVCFFIILYALSASLSKSVQSAKEELEEMMKEQQIQGEVKVTKDGLYLTLEEQEGTAYFESGNAEVTAQGKEVLGKVAPILSKLPNEIVVEGHTDNVPIHTAAFDSNWELSTARATNVVKHLVTAESMKPDRLAAIGYGEYKPLTPNDTPESRAKNRRVVFFVKKK